MRRPYYGRNVAISDFVASYLNSYAMEQKSPLTVRSHRELLAMWVDYLGEDKALKNISLPEVLGVADTAWGRGVGPARINRAIGTLKQALEFARAMHYLPQSFKLPTDNWEPIPQPPARVRTFLSVEDVEKLIATAGARASKTIGNRARLLADYLALLAHSGMRRTEALYLEWTDIDFKNRRVTLQGTKRMPDGKEVDWTKNRVSRVIPFNAKLENLLRDMNTRACSRWLFPREGNWTIPARGFEDSFDRVRRTAGMPTVGLHDFRHHFISRCVMAGIDFLTVSRWAGHQDGGLLIAKVYGHINDYHSRAMANKLDAV
jgi:integrase